MTTATEQAAFEGLMEKIAKLQALADRAGTEHEAQAAAAKMQRLLTKHNLTTLDVEQFRAQRGRETKVMTYPADKSPWKAKLLGVVTGHHFCVAVRQDAGDGPRYVIWGREENLVVVHAVYRWLLGVVPKFADEAWERAQHEHRRWWGEAGTKEARRWKHSYRLGVIDGISEAYRQARMADAHEDVWGLVPLLEQEARDHMKEDTGDITEQANYGEMTHHFAYARGYHRGRALNVADNQLEEAT